jgi:UDP-2,3-diacylglucosamine hydrolase
LQKVIPYIAAVKNMPTTLQIAAGKKIFFLSDFHLGAPNEAASRVREKKIVAFLESIKNEMSHLFLLGDMFDFWYEYKFVVPKGHTRILGKLAEIADAGIPIYFFMGNHDMWMRGYFEAELGIPVFKEPETFIIHNKTFMIGHGDGLGPADHGYKFIKKVFRNPVCQWLFGALHPRWGIGLANYLSRRSRAMTGSSDQHFLGEDKEWLIIHCKEELQKQHFDYFIFGHRHLPIDQQLTEKSRYVNLGDWITHDSYATFDGQTLSLLYHK